MVSHSSALLKATAQLQNAAVEELCGEKHPFLQGFECRVYEIVAQTVQGLQKPLKHNQRAALSRHSLAQGPWEHRVSPTVPVPSATAPERRLPKQGSEHTHITQGEGLSLLVHWQRVTLQNHPLGKTFQDLQE